MPTGKEITARAREWVGTPFGHQRRHKGSGIDCVGLVLATAESFELVDATGKPFHHMDHIPYNPQPSGRQVLKICQARLLRAEVKDLKEGNVVVMRVPIEPCHAGFITKRKGVDYIIHAFNSGKEPKCVEHILDAQWRRRIVAAFSIPGVVD